MIKGYLNQTAVWKQVVGRNEFNEPITEETIIRVRWEGKRRLVRNVQGEEVISEARVFCKEMVLPGDLLEYDDREWLVIAVSTIPDLHGEACYREVAL